MLRQLHIDGFVHFTDFPLEFGPGLNVVHGPNEAGKSTLLRFVRFVLFGPPRLVAERGLPLSGTRYGGTLWIGPLRVHRNDQGVEVTAEGLPQPESALHDILGQFDQAAFDAVYACDLDDLQEMGALKAEALRRKLFASTVLGTGADVEAVEARWHKRRKALDTRGRGGLVWRLEQELAAARTELHSARASAEELPGMVDRQTRLDADIERLDQEHQLADRQAQALEALGGDDGWLTVRARCREWLETHPRPSASVAEWTQRVEELLETDRQLEQARAAEAAAEARLEDAQRTEASVAVDERVLARRGWILALIEQRSELASLSELEDRVAGVRTELQARLAALGLKSIDQLDLTEQTVRWLKRLADEVPTVVAAESLEEASRATADAVESARHALEGCPPPGPALEFRHRQDELQGAQERAGDLRAEVERLEPRVNPTDDVAELPDRRSQLDETTAKLEQSLAGQPLDRTALEASARVPWGEVQELGQGVLQQRADEEPAEHNRRFIMRTASVTGFLLVVAVVVVAVLAGLGDTSTGVVIVAVVLGLAALGGARVLRTDRLARQAAREAEVRLSTLVAGVQGLSEVELHDLVEVASHAPTWLDQLGTLRELESEVATLEQQATVLEQLQTARSRLEREEREIAQALERAEVESLAELREAVSLAVWRETRRSERQSQLEACEQEQSRAEQALSAAVRSNERRQTALRTLEDALQAAGWPSEEPSQVGALAERLFVVRDAHTVLVATEHAHEMASARWDAWRQDVIALSTELEPQREAGLEAEAWIHDVGQRLAQTEAGHALRLQHARTLEEARQAHERTSEELQAAVQTRQLARTRADDLDVDGARSQLEEARRWESLEAEFAQAEEAIRTQLPDIDPDELTGEGQLERAIAKARGRVDGLRDHKDAQIERRGALKQAIEDLSGSADVAVAAERMASLEARLHEARLELAEIELASHWLKQAYEQYVRANQPAVLQRASELLKRASDGTMVGVRQHDRRLFVESVSGGTREPHELSRGSREMLYLVIRLALALEHAERTEVPMLLDDVMVNQDPQRARQIARILQAVGERHQLILMTCRPETRDLMASEDPSATVIELKRRLDVR